MDRCKIRFPFEKMYLLLKCVYVCMRNINIAIIIEIGHSWRRSTSDFKRDMAIVGSIPTRGNGNKATHITLVTKLSAVLNFT